MIRRTVLLLAIFLVLPTTANAGLLRYEFNFTGPVYNATGYMDFSDTIAGPGDIIGDLQAWSFNFAGNTVDNTNSVLTGGQFVVDNALQMVDALVCFSGTGVCNANQVNRPFFILAQKTLSWRGAANNVDTGNIATDDSFTFAGPKAVPEPSALVLLGLGLIGLALARRLQQS